MLRTLPNTAGAETRIGPGRSPPRSSARSAQRARDVVVACRRSPLSSRRCSRRRAPRRCPHAAAQATRPRAEWVVGHRAAQWTRGHAQRWRVASRRLARAAHARGEPR
eukprot:scaffold36454_cov68-Phaeocystis_antarctica.AAC.9